MKKQKTKKRQYKSPESRARQLAALANVRIEDHVMGVKMEKINGKGDWASVSEEKRKEILKLYTQGHTIVAIAEKLGMSKTVVGDVKLRAIDTDTEFADAMFRVNIRQKLHKAAESSLDRVQDLISEMSPRDATLAMEKTFDLVLKLDKEKKPEINSINLHLHGNDSKLQSEFLAAMGEKENKTIDI